MKRNYGLLIAFVLILAVIMLYLSFPKPKTEQTVGPLYTTPTTEITQIVSDHDHLGFPPFTPTAEPPYMTPTVDLTRAIEWACKATYRGHTYTVPYNGFEGSTTVFGYTWGNLWWKLGLVCEPQTNAPGGPGFPRMRLVYDVPIIPTGNVHAFICGDTNVTVSGQPLISKHCREDGTINMDISSIDGATNHTLMWRYTYHNVDTDDTNTIGPLDSPWHLEYQLDKNLLCQWKSNSYDSYYHPFNYGHSGHLSGYLSQSGPETVICAGNGYTISLSTNN